jgi:CheY-like chemotaxis protein
MSRSALMREQNTPCVMIVEDDRDTREMLARFLELEGYLVRQAENGERALEELRRDGNTSVILLDLMMPVMNGWQFRSAQENDPEMSRIPVVVVTAAGPQSEIPTISADAWVPKPVDFDKLLATLEPLCKRS